MIDPKIYYNVYLLFVSILTIVYSFKYASYPNERLTINVPHKKLPLFFIASLFILFIGLRPISGVFIDMMNYNASYGLHLGRIYAFTLDTNNFIFDNLFYYLASSNYAIEVFFFIIATIYFGGIAIACQKLFPKDAVYAFVIYAGAFSTFSYATNGIKAGAAAAIFLCAIGLYKKKLISIILLILSLGFHHSMVLPIVAFIICKYYRNPKFYLIVWVISLLIAAAHITYFQTLFGGMTDDHGASYLAMDNSGYRTGFRLDFVIYSSAPVILGYYIINKWRYSSKTYNFIYCLYLLTNSVWMLCMYASFTNRIAYLSWFMLPIVLIYPFFDKPFIRNQYRKLNVVVWCHLGFTLMMTYVYYIFIK